MPMICSARRWIRPEIDFENEGGETYICGNPPYLRNQRQTDCGTETRLDSHLFGT